MKFYIVMENNNGGSGDGFSYGVFKNKANAIKHINKTNRQFKEELDAWLALDPEDQRLDDEPFDSSPDLDVIDIPSRPTRKQLAHILTILCDGAYVGD